MSLILDKITYKYSPGTPFETTALDNVSLKINDGEFLGIIGHTGSGKSTLIQHLNGLLKATSGGVYYNGEDIYDKSFNLKTLRTNVGMVFQYPEHQLFETTVLEDVKFGPKNMGLNDKEASIKAYEALELLRFPRELITQSPFDLSGGRKRLAAIAGVLAMKPSVIILDEPTAGLDPGTGRHILDCVKSMQEKTGITLVLVSHSMNEVASYASRVVVMDKGTVIMDDIPERVFSRVEELEALGLAAPEVCYLLWDLKKAGFNVNPGVLTEEEAIKEIQRALKEKNA